MIGAGGEASEQVPHDVQGATILSGWVELGQIGDDFLLGVTRDELDVERACSIVSPSETRCDVRSAGSLVDAPTCCDPARRRIIRFVRQVLRQSSGSGGTTRFANGGECGCSEPAGFVDCWDWHSASWPRARVAGHGLLQAPTCRRVTRSVRTLEVSSGTTPTFTWRPECRLGALSVRRANDSEVMWYINTHWQLAPGIRYGAAPTGALVRVAPKPLEGGVRYVVYVMLPAYATSRVPVLGSERFTP